MDKVRVGVIGCGFIAMNTYLPAMVKFDTIRLVATCDAVYERAEEARLRFGADRSYSNRDDLLADSEIDAVVILTQGIDHPGSVNAALDAGKHVYVEKPIASTLDEARALVEKSRLKGLKLACAPSTILGPIHQKVKEIIEAGYIGKVCFARAHGSNPGPAWFPIYSTDPSWFYKRGAGPLRDLAIYQLQALTYFLGPVKRVSAMSVMAIPRRTIRAGIAKGKTVELEENDCTLVLLDFGDNTLAAVDCTWCVRAFKGPMLEIYGGRGTVNINPHITLTKVNAWTSPIPVEVFIEDDALNVRGWVEPLIVAPESFTLAAGVDHLARCIMQDKMPLISPEHATHLLEIMIRAEESAATGKSMQMITSF